MGERTYRASLSKSQGREGWSIIFRHPVRIDPATGNAGRRVRHGLGTRDAEEASRLVDEMNQLLNDPAFWEISARPRAERLFEPRVVEIFYYELAPESPDFFSIRDSAIPLPSSKDTHFRRMLLVGTTGSGKTTLVRQFLGTDPKTERFPSTSTAKTTIADMEFVLSEGLFKVVVTFLPRDQVLDYVEECVSAAVLTAYYGASDSEILRRLLNHVSQRFRLSYILGTGGEDLVGEEDEDTWSEDDVRVEHELIDLEHTSEVLRSAVEHTRQMAKAYGQSLRSELGATETDERIIEEIFEENLDHMLREDERFHAIVDQLMDEIEQRFELLPQAELEKTRQGWPRAWRWQTEDRESFINTVTRFSSNHAAYFGSLLTPLVNGIRVAGPFKPQWVDDRPDLVLLDQEGLGHSPESSVSLPTSVTRRFDEVDVIMLVDNPTHPMQAAAVSVLRGVAASGNSSKLLVCFTHLDAVRGDNLPTFQAKKEHIIASADNVLPSIGQEIGPFAERALRKRVETGCFFVGGIDAKIEETSRHGARTLAQLRALLSAIDEIVRPPAPVEATPVYDRMNLVLAVKEAAESFHDAWSARLGYRAMTDVRKAHWASVKALSRRLAEGWADEWAGLRPVADLHRELEGKIYVFIQSPLEWEPVVPSDDEKQQVFEQFANSISSRVREIAARRIRVDRMPAWQEAYSLRGQGSTFVRASIIKGEVYEKAAPIPGIEASPGRNKFLREVVMVVEAAAAECGVKLQ